MRLSRKHGRELEAASTGLGRGRWPPGMTQRPRPRRPLGCARQWTEDTGMGTPGAGRTSRRGLRPTCRPGHGVRFPGEIRKWSNSAGPSPFEELGDVPTGVAATPTRPTDPQSPSSARGQAEKKAPRPGLALRRSRPGPAPSCPGPAPPSRRRFAVRRVYTEGWGVILEFPYWPLGLLRTS